MSREEHIDTGVDQEVLPASGGAEELHPGVDFVQPEADETPRGVLSSGITALKAAAVTMELLPVTNEGARYSAFVYAQTFSHNPALGAAVLGGSTLLVEGAGVLGSASWIAQDRIQALTDKIDRKFANTKLAALSPKQHIPDNLHISSVAEAGIAMTFGSVALLEAKQRENPQRTSEQNVRRGLMTASWMAGVFAVEGALLAEGVDDYSNPTVVGPALLGLAGVMGAIGWAKRRMRKEAKEEKQTDE